MTTALVTGASGFIAKHIVGELLDKNYTVKASVRSDSGREQLEALFPGKLEFVTLDLTSDDGWAEAMNGVDVLLHTASPFPNSAPSDPEELIRPAVDGTLRALGAAQSAGVTRVILTSSCAAIYKDAAKPKMAQSTRDNWTDPTGPDTSAYEASKTLAEKAAWDFVAAHPEMTLTTICPGGVLGRPADDHYGTSLEYIEQALSGKFSMLPRMNLPVVDVQDVATMHVAAIDNEATFGQRYPATVGAVTFLEVTGWLNQAYPERKLSTRLAPNWLLRLVARFNPLLRPVVGNLDRNSDVDGSDGPRDMGFTYISARESVLTSAEFLVAHGI